MCEQCGNKFKQKWALTVHRRSHVRKRDFVCKICSKAFINNKDLKRHETIHLGSIFIHIFVFDIKFIVSF